MPNNIFKNAPHPANKNTGLSAFGPAPMQSSVQDADKIEEYMRMYESVSELDPVDMGKVLEISRTLGVSPQAIMYDQKSAQKALQRPNSGYWTWIMSNRPNTAKYVSDPYKLSAVRDILDGVTQEESYWTKTKRGWRIGSLNVKLSRLGLDRMMYALQTGQRPTMYDKEIQAIYDEMAQIGDVGGLLPDFAKQLPQYGLMAERAGVFGAIGMTGGFLLGLGGGVAATPIIPGDEVVAAATGAKIGASIFAKAGVIEAAFILEAGSAFEEFISMQDKDGNYISPRYAALGAVVAGAINAGLELVSIDILTKRLKYIPGVKEIFETFGKEKVEDLVKRAGKGKGGGRVIIDAIKEWLVDLTFEEVQEMTQNLVSMGAGEVLKSTSGQPFESATFKDYWDNITSVIMPTFHTSVMTNLFGFGTATVQSIHQLNQTRNDVQAYKEVGEIAAKSEHLDRTRDGFQQFLDMNLDEDMKTIYVDAEPFLTYMQDAAEKQNLNLEETLKIVALELGIDPQAIKDAAEAKAPIAVPYSAWVANTAKTPLYQAMEEHVRFNPEGITLAQAKYEQERIIRDTEETQKRAEELIAENEAMQAGYDMVYEDIKKKLTIASQPETIKSKKSWQNLIDIQARAWASRAVTEATRRGITVEEWYQKYNRPYIIGPNTRWNMNLSPHRVTAAKEMLLSDVFPELKPALKDMAETMLTEIGRSAKGKYGGVLTEYGYVNTPMSRVTSDTVAELLDSGFTYAEIEKGIKDYLEDGKVTLITKRIEDAAHWALLLGYGDETMLVKIPPNEEYIELVRKLAERVPPEFRDDGDADTLETLAQEALHASLADFERFSLEKIGTGVGQNLKGWGLNFTTSEALHDYYRQMFEQYRAKEGQKAIGYRVDIAEDSDLMNWETTLAEQPAKVQQGIEKILKKYPELNSLGNINAREFYYALVSVLGSAKSASLALRDVGIPGHSYIMDAHEYGKVKNFVIYDEEAIKIKEKRYYQSLDSLGFYSPTYHAISEMDFKSMPAKDLLNRIKKLPGIKAEELEWIGLPEYLEGLAQQGQKVTKEEVLAFVEAGGVKLQEVTKELKIIPVKISSLTREEFNEKWKERYWKLYLEDLLMDRAIKRWDEMSDKKKERYGNSFGNYGLRVLEEGHWTDWLSTEEFETYREELWRNGQDISYDVTYDDSTELGQYPQYEKYKLPGGENYREVLLTLPQVGDETFRSRHWDEKNVLVHFRLTDRTDESGNKTLLVEEIQSDWHQIGREKGYRKHLSDAEYRRIQDAATAVIKKNNNYGYDTLDEALEFIRRNADFAEILDITDESDIAALTEYRENIDTGAVIDAPFKNTDAWAMLAFKRILRMAAEQGYDSVAWTTGEQQAERYNLEKVIDHVLAGKVGEGLYSVEAQSRDGRSVYKNYKATTKEVVSVFGKELGNKIITESDAQYERAGRPELSELDIAIGGFAPSESRVIIQGEGLKMGGEGMKGFYDKILPAAVQKYLKKLDPSVKVGMKSVKTDDGMVEVHGIKITDAIREAVLAGQPLFQDKRGETRIGPNTSVIELFKIADASTFMHESAHLWLYDMFEYVKSGEADEAYMKDWNVLKDWLKIADDQTDLTVEQQEKFARGFERYLMEGVAPSKGLRKIFAALKRWLIKIYQTADALNVEMTDEVRGVMGRMLTTEAEVEQAQKKTGLYESLITEADVDVDLWQFMDEYRARAHDEAVSQLLKKQMEELEEQRKQALSLEALEQNNAVLEEMFVEPMYAAQYHLHATYGLDVKKTVTAFLDGYLDYDTKEILEHVAERYGFSCAREMAMEIAINPTFEEEQTARLVERLREKGELLTPERLEADAMDAIHNEFQEELIALENVILQEILQNEQAKIQRKVALERARIMTKAARKKAKEILSAKPYNEAAAFKVYYAMERDAAAKAAHYKAKGNKAKAQQYAEERMIAHALAIEAVNNAKEVDKILEYIKPLRMRGRSLLNMPADFVAQIDSLLARFGFIEERPLAPGETVESLSAFCERMAEEYQELPIADIILADRFRKPYTKMTMGELRELYRALKVISVAGRKHNQFFMLFNKANIREAAKEIKQSIESNVGEPYAKDKRPGSKTTLEKILSIPDEIGAWLLKPEFIARFLDGDKDNGPMQRFLIQAFSKAWQEEFQMQQRVIKEMREIIGKFYTEKEMRAMSREREYVPILNKKMTRENLLLFALNLGNDGNKQRLLDGYELSEKQAMEVVDSLTEKDWQLVQAIWDYLDTFWPAIKKLEEEVAGVEPERVEATPIETKYGVFRGGYFPVKYDPEKSSQASKHAEQGKALYAEMPTARAMTKHGHTKQRATKVKRPILLSWKVLSNHLIDVAHDLTHRKAVIDANRLLRNPDVRVAIENAVGVKGFRSLEDSIKAIASGQGEVTTWLDRTFLWMRSRSTLHALGLNLRVALLQLSGINQAMWEIGAIPTLKGIASFATSPKATWDFVKEKSIFMRERAMVFDRDVYAFHRQMFDKDTKLAKFAFYLHAFMDQMWCVPTWTQAYQSALAKGMTEEQAIENADGVIRRAAGSGAEKDLSAAQRGSELQKAFTMFYSFGNLLYNRYWLSMKRTGVLLKQGQGLDAAKQIAGMVAYGWILPGIFEFALREALRSKGDDEEEPEELYKRFGAATLSGPLQTIPLIRDFGSFVINRIFGQYSEYRITPIESAFEEAWRTVEKGREIMEGEGEWTDFAEQAVDTAAYTQGIPKQIVTWIFNALDWFRDFGEADWRDLFSRKHK